MRERLLGCMVVSIGNLTVGGTGNTAAKGHPSLTTVIEQAAQIRAKMNSLVDEDLLVATEPATSASALDAILVGGGIGAAITSALSARSRTRRRNAPGGVRLSGRPAGSLRCTPAPAVSALMPG